MQLRHPNILAFKDTAEVEEHGETVIYLVTESVSSLTSVLANLNIDGPQRDQYVCVGIHQIVSAVSFLSNDCKLVHGNVCANSVVVTDALDWKLHAFDLTTEHSMFASISTGYGAVAPPIAAASWAVPAQFQPGELAKSDWSTIADGPTWAIDSWGLGCLMHEVFSGTRLTRMEELRETASIAKPVLPFYQRLLASQGSKRLNPAELVEDRVLKNKLWETIDFIENLALKDASEKDIFFKRLPSITANIPVPVLQRKLLPLLASALEFGGAPPVALSTLLSIGDTLSQSEREQKVIPILSKLFASSDRGIRRGLLENINSFGSALPDSLVESQIYPSVQSGFTDTNPYLRELTLKSMAVLGSKLSAKTLNQNLLKHLARLQVDEEPAIRANTTVLLSNLASSLSEATCKKVLLNAFARAVKDPFPPARAAGVKAVISTSKYHGPESVANRILPMIGPLCIDPISEVRSAALQCIDHYMKFLHSNHEEIEKKMSSNGGNISADEKSILSTAGSSSNLLTGLGWAVSSFVTKGGQSGPSQDASSHLAKTEIKQTVIENEMKMGTSPARFGSIAESAAHGNTRSQSKAFPKDNPLIGLDNPLIEKGTHGSKDDKGGWDMDDDPFEDLVDDVSLEYEARKKLHTASLSGVNDMGTQRKGKGIGSGSLATRKTPPMSKTLDAGAAKAPSSSMPTSKPAKKAGGMKLGSGNRGMKLGATKLTMNDDDFSEW